MIDIALFGLGRIGIMHGKNLMRNKDFNLRYVYDINKNLTKKYSKILKAESVDNPNIIFKDKKIKSNKNIKYALTHNYSAYPMVRQAKQMIKKGKIGKIEYINVEYIQDWLKGINITTKNAKKILKWKIDKKIVGSSAVLNEIGSHAYHLAIYISGLKGHSLFADSKSFSKKIKSDANVQAMVNFKNGAKGMFWISSVPRGGVYGLKIRIF